MREMASGDRVGRDGAVLNYCIRPGRVMYLISSLL